MASIDEFLDRKYMHKDELPPDGSGVVLTIDQIEVEKMDDGKPKPVAHFVEKGFKPVVLNVTNMKKIASVAGSRDFADWPGTEMEFFNEIDYEYQEHVGAIRCRRPTNRPRSLQEQEELNDVL